MRGVLTAGDVFGLIVGVAMIGLAQVRPPWARYGAKGGRLATTFTGVTLCALGLDHFVQPAGKWAVVAGGFVLALGLTNLILWMRALAPSHTTQ